jgi:hypothetical protein
MAGCYGNHPEDRYFERQLNEHLDKEAAFEKLQEQCEELAEDKFQVALLSLPLSRPSNLAQSYYYLNFEDVLAELKVNSCVELAKLVRDNKPDEAGAELIRVVYEHLRKVAKEEAEMECGL